MIGNKIMLKWIWKIEFNLYLSNYKMQGIYMAMLQIQCQLNLI